MKKNVILLLCIILIIIGICIYFIISNNETFDKSAEEYFNMSNKVQEDTVSNSNIFSSPKTAEGGAFGQVTRTLKEDTITNSGATIIITNRTNVKFDYMAWFSIEQKVSDEWGKIESNDANNGKIESTYIMPNESIEMKLDWSKYYGTLKNGEYRLVFDSFSNLDEYDYIEFSIR